jgi:hypothetical protein
VKLHARGSAIVRSWRPRASSRCSSSASEAQTREAPRQGLGDRAVVAPEGEQPLLELGERGADVRGQRLALGDRDVELHLVSQEAWIGRWMRRRLRQRPCRRSIGARRVCGEPLSTIQKTVRAEAWGAVVITCSTSRRIDPGALLAAIEEARMVDVPGGVAPRVRAAPSG